MMRDPNGIGRKLNKILSLVLTSYLFYLLSPLYTQNCMHRVKTTSGFRLEAPPTSPYPAAPSKCADFLYLWLHRKRG